MRSPCTTGCVFLLCVCVWLVLAADVQAGVDEGVTRYVPWSGSYWPIREGALIRGPLAKYDRITGRQAARWEFQENPPHGEVPEWFGYCHAWSAAAVLDHEPSRMQAAIGLDGAPVNLGIDDQKGLLTACHTDDVAQHYGIRYDGQPDDDPQDIYPDQLWRVLKLYVQQRGVPIIIDVESGTQVWNYPVYAYRVVYRPTGQGDRYFAEMTLWMADDAVPPNILGVQISKQTFYFTFSLREGAAQLGTGRWVEPSVNNHPDFAWFPYVVRAENPEVDYERVRQLLGFPAADASPIPLGPGNIPSATGDPSAPPTTSIPLDNRGTHPTVLTVPPNTIPVLPSQPTESPAGLGGVHVTPGGHVENPTAAAPQPWLLSPMELLSLILNQTSHFDLDVTVDKFDGGHYDPGQPLTVRGTSARSGYLYLFYIDSQGGLMLLFPREGQRNWIQADARFHVPSAADDQTFHVAGPPGVHRIKAVVTTQPLMFTGLSTADHARVAATGLPPGGPSPAGPARMGPSAWGPTGRFALPPSQATMVRRQLAAHLQGKKNYSKTLDAVSCRTYLKEFAQDETAFYVRERPNSVQPAIR